ncbi:MAG: MlaD family protein [Lactobacillaceae bacterium]|nr:MlaD family protein [Lactobacillaceae bacterium]
MNKKPIETIMGIIVIFIAASFIYFSYNASDLRVVKGYEITVNFLKVGGLNIGSDVRINGVKVGTVVSQSLDNENYHAVIKLSVASNIKLPKDSTFEVATDGLMGDKFIKVQPGTSLELLKNGDTATNTKDFKTIEDMVGEIIFAVTGGDGNEVIR